MKRVVLALSVGLLVTSFGCSEDVDTQPVQPAVKSRRGESCAATNDCRDDLACVQNTCIQDEYPISPTAKECFRIECSDAADCCADFVPDLSCPTYEENCAAGDQLYCDLVDQLCQCTLECVNETCTFPTPPCVDDIECFTGVCEGGVCVQCREDTDCGTAGKCSSNVCVNECTRNEECPLFNSCDNGECTATGCTSDRECILFSGDAQATCKDGECRVPCESNAQCGALQVCSDGVCEFIGCETNDECRTYLGVQFEEGVTVVCRDPSAP